MDALPTHPPSSLLHKPPLIPTTTTTNHHPLYLPKPSPSSSTSNTLSTTSLLTKPLSLTSSKFPSISLPTFSPPKHPPTQTHRKAATGYAAALLDVAICDGTDLGAVARDARRVRRVVGLVMGDERVEKKGQVVRKVVEDMGGRFYGKLVALVRMLVDRGKVGVVGEVMDEFERLGEELGGVDKVSRKNKSFVY